MKKPVILILLLALTPLSVEHLEAIDASNRHKFYPIRLDIPALVGYRKLLEERGVSADRQGVLIETLDGHELLAEQNADIGFNPASVMKLSTSLVALSKLGPDYHFRTDFLADGSVDPVTRTLYGDLVVEGGNDPVFSAADAEHVARELQRVGVSRVTGGLRIAGGFIYFALGYEDALSAQTSADKLLTGLKRSGVSIANGVRFGAGGGKLLVSHYSNQLSKILLFQNAHSVNAIAEIVGRAVGGPVAIQDFLVNQVGVRDGDIFVARPSGLDFNRITPRASLKVLRRLMSELRWYGMKLEDIMPVAGVDCGTLRGRFESDQVRGSIIAKTGTLISLDGGVSTLVGIAHTRELGTILFAVFNAGGSVYGYRQLQDRFISEVVAEEGGGRPSGRMEDGVAGYVDESIVQDVYRSSESAASERAGD
ncbi:MAG TPA: D-alanyl-D-alanine carboxypeptidase [Blastocatellia bacterium]|nr:D-alanyl-D-alanine carboxypeptidase [Blastocatellia bacterium]